jgi:hypothetical protein
MMIQMRLANASLLIVDFERGQLVDVVQPVPSPFFLLQPRSSLSAYVSLLCPAVGMKLTNHKATGPGTLV